MGIKISDLTSATSLTGSEELPIVQSSTTKKTTTQNLFEGTFSTNEQICGVWTNGKPLYRKIVELPALPNATTKNYAHGISNLEQIVFTNGSIYWTTGASEGSVMPYFAGGATYCTFYWDTTNITVRTGSDYSARSGLVILYYTKTTDNATRGTEQLRSTGELVGIGDRAEVNENNIIGDTPQEKAEIIENPETKESGDNESSSR